MTYRRLLKSLLASNWAGFNYDVLFVGLHEAR